MSVPAVSPLHQWYRSSPALSLFESAFRRTAEYLSFHRAPFFASTHPRCARHLALAVAQSRSLLPIFLPPPDSCTSANQSHWCAHPPAAASCCPPPQLSLSPNTPPGAPPPAVASASFPPPSARWHECVFPWSHNIRPQNSTSRDPRIFPAALPASSPSRGIFPLHPATPRSDSKTQTHR